MIGGGGNDRITIGFGYADGGAGDDVVRATAPQKVVNRALEQGSEVNLDNEVGDHASLLHGDLGNDRVEGGPASDQLWGDEGNDKLSGGAGGDELFGLEGRDILLGGKGADDLQGDSHIERGSTHESDTIRGGPGRDFLSWGDRNEAVTVDLAANGSPDGEKGENEHVSGVEIVFTGSKKDRLIGTSADELFHPGGGSDSIRGGGGKDTISYSGSTKRVQVNLSDSEPDGPAGARDKLTGIENANGGDRADVLVGTGERNILQGRGGNDKLTGAGGNDELYGLDDIKRSDSELDNEGGELQDEENSLDGGSGDDLLSGGYGADNFDGGPGDDEMRGTPYNPSLFVTLGPDVADYSSRTNPITAQTSVGGGEEGEQDTYVRIDAIRGGSGDDVLTGSNRDDGDSLFGGPGNDVLDGLRGFDFLAGGSGDDTLNAKDGEEDEVNCGADTDSASVDTDDTEKNCEQVS